MLLVIEVAQTSTEADHLLKLPLYARSGIPEVWIVDLSTSMIEAFREPMGDRYARVSKAGRGQELVPVAPAIDPIRVDEILP